MPIKIYYSREDRIGQLNDEDERFSYESPEADEGKAENAMEACFDFAQDLNDSMDLYLDSLHEMQESDDPEIDREMMLHTRAQMVHQWAMLQAAVSKFAWVFRINGNEAFQRLIDSLHHDGVTDMQNL